MAWASILGGLASGAAGSLLAPSAPSAPQLPYQGGAANNLYGDIGGLNNPYSSLQPYYFQQMMAAMNNPDISGFLKGAKTAGGMYDVAGNNAVTGGNMLMRNANDIYGQSFDPQNALRSQLEQRVRDQSNVTNSMYGLGGSGSGAGVANQNLTNFDIDWQNQQLQRMLEGNTAIGKDVGGAHDLYTGAAQDYMAGGQVPYSAYGTVTGDVSSALDKYMQSAATGNTFQQNAIGDWLQYLGMGQSGVGLNQNAFDQNQRTAGMYGASLYPAFNQGFNQLFSGSTPSSGGSPTGDVSSGNWDMYGGGGPNSGSIWGNNPGYVGGYQP